MDMLLWWEDHGEAFPLLSFLVRAVFSDPAASSKSHWVFTAAGSVISQGRIKLNLALLREYGKWGNKSTF